MQKEELKEILLTNHLLINFSPIDIDNFIILIKKLLSIQKKT